MPIGCAGTVSDQPCPAPPITLYSADFNLALADQIELICTNPATAEACRALRDCCLLRAQIRACGKGEGK
ncbi:hypothetical protein [Desulfarculus baarsii]